jgi:predicted GH43/DUF377 family glycosyl hydrolase
MLGIALSLAAALIAFIFRIVPEVIKLFRLKRHDENPVLSPPEYGDWEAIGTFNPAAVKDDLGNVHIIYRAIGADGMSRFGYAVSKDGKNFGDKSPYPVFVMHSPRSDLQSSCKRFSPVMYPSGGSWGGCEDPRMVRMDGKIYLSFNAFDGWDYIRMAVSSINENDFFNRKWKWSKPILISAPNTISKNWVLFPEKINGKYAILHSIVPKILIEYVDNIDSPIEPITSPRKQGPQPGRKDSWDNWIRGAGPPPIKTDRGWLLLYHAGTDGDYRYKLGAMLLDLNNPTIITHRSPNPVLISEEWYENEWKPGIVYACGAVIKDGELFVYYGGGDKHVCVAHTPLNELLDSLIPNTPA